MADLSPPGNGHVTNAVLSTKLDSLTEEVRRLGLKMDHRFAFLEEKADIRTGAVEAACHQNQTQIARLEERQKATTGILGGLTFVASAIAGAVGSLVK